MQHIRRLFISTLLFLFLCTSPILVLAHSGRTDSNGGHYNRSTGEYHYHHGYSAHDHWDMDEDGDLDCPYSFDDQTNHKYGSNSTNTNSSTQTKTNDNSTRHNKGNDKIYAYISIGFVGTFFILVNCIAIHIDKTEKSAPNEPTSIPSIIISATSTIIVFVLLFSIMFLCKKPIQLKPISFINMVGILFFSTFPSLFVMVFTTWASAIFNMPLCSLFNVEAYCGLDGPFKRLTVPLSYAFTVLLFIL